MSVRLIRKNSDTPNITNRDDARMIRYAYGGQNGFVKGKGAELSHNVNGNVFTINSGVINLQGWEVEIDSNGWSTTLSASDAARKYCAVYCEVNLSLGGSTKIDLMTALNGYPDVPEGDDLTSNPNGTARLVLYQFIAQSGNISEVNKIVYELRYTNTDIEEIKSRLDSLGFKEGAFELFINGSPLSGQSIIKNSLKKQGKYIIANLALYGSPNQVVEVKIPKEFCPKNEIPVFAVGSYIPNPNVEKILITPTGEFSLSNKSITTEILNVGWEVN